MRDKVVRLAALITGALTLAAGAPAAAAERPLTRAEVMKMAKDGVVLCEGWREADGSCQSLLFLDQDTGGAIVEVDRMQLALEPDVAVGIRNPVTLDGAAVCTTVDFGPQHTVILMDGAPDSGEMASGFLEALKASLTAYDGKRACESFRKDEATGTIKSSTTIDGRAAPELESNYRILPGDSKVRLRPLIEGDKSEQSI